MLKRANTQSRKIPDVHHVEDEQIQDVLRRFREVMIEQEGLGRDGNQGYVRVQDLVDAGIAKVIDGKLVKA